GVRDGYGGGLDYW
nr:immunoglobulin heavy chain junction region [Macaca mulatta]